MEHNKIKIGVTQGDINSTSYEIMLKAFLEPMYAEKCTPIIYGSPKISAYYRKALNINNSSFNTIQNIGEAQDRKVNLLNVLDDNAKVDLGKATQMSAEASVTSLESAVTDLASGKLSAVVLNPINTKMTASLNVADQFSFVRKKLEASNTMTMLVNGTVRVALLSDNSPMRDISKHLTVDNIVAKLRIVSNALKSDFGIDKPKIAVLGYNPNCMNAVNQEREESEVLIPAIEKANAENILAMGPYDADIFFGTSLFQKFDAVLALHYSQGMVPFRALSYDDGISYMIGMPQLCVAPVSEVDYDQAGTDQAQPSAFQGAMCFACNVLDNRALHRQLTSNPLQKHNIAD